MLNDAEYADSKAREIMQLNFAKTMIHFMQCSTPIKGTWFLKMHGTHFGMWGI